MTGSYFKSMKTVLITGASGNLGQALVEHLHEQNYRILAVAGSSRGARSVAHLSNVQTTVVDVLNEQSVVEFLTEKQTDDIQAAVLLVGGFAMGTIEQTDAESLQTMFQLNFLSAFNIVKPLMKRFEQTGSGQFILIGARPALNPDQGKNVVAYALSKSLIFNLAELINAQGKTHNITATVVVPSTIDTPANRAAMPDADFGKWVPTSSLAELIGFLLSDTGRMTRETVVKLYNQV